MRRLQVEHEHQQLSLFHENTVIQRAAFLEAVELLCGRIENLYQNWNRGWLSSRDRGAYGYYLYSFAYRVLSLISVCYQIEKDANYVRSVAAVDRGGDLRSAAKLNIAAWTRASLFDGLSYDDEQAPDHFYRDALAEVTSHFGDLDNRLPISTFRALVPGSGHAYQEVFDFLEGLVPEEQGRYRYDRVVAVYLVGLGSLALFDRMSNEDTYSTMRRGAEQCRNSEVLVNLGRLVEASSLSRKEGYRVLMRVLADEVQSRT
ncbi:hypothetical protein [Streptomyces sp. DSM 40484]|uniref:hypothetical protein n=1 Tax=Streptomyces kroppenstedtii TaxID=3051181 RepID=UPI0028D688BC|nr:hypothetical protein [Streptomyces sp. DSM 40484]